MKLFDNRAKKEFIQMLKQNKFSYKLVNNGEAINFFEGANDHLIEAFFEIKKEMLWIGCESYQCSLYELPILYNTPDFSHRSSINFVY